MPAPTPDGDRLEVGLAALWTVYTDPRLAGVFELFLAARTDPDLQARLSPILLAHAERELALARQIFPQAAHRDDFDAVVIGLLSTLQGAAVASWALPGEAGTRELAFLTQLIRRELRAPTPPRRRRDRPHHPAGLPGLRPHHAAGVAAPPEAPGAQGLRPGRLLRQPVHGQRLRAARHGLEARHRRLLRLALPVPALRSGARVVDVAAAALPRRLLHVLVPPHGPRGAPDVVRPPQPPQLRALQPVHGAAAVLDRAAGPPAVLGPAAPAGLPRRDDHHPDGPEPAVPVLAAHRAHRRHGALRVAVQHPGLPPGAPRPERAVPRPQLCGNLHPLGPDLRHLRAGGRGRRLRRDHPIDSHNPFYIAFVEYGAWLQDVRSAQASGASSTTPSRAPAGRRTATTAPRR